jgi:hypothetical protein
MLGISRSFVQLKGILLVIFEELDPEWLIGMWRAGGESHRDMIDIVHMFYLLKARL